ncbi:MAG: hypothetical protein ACRYG2_05075 [Janthinobacterium lividum]
MTFPCRTGSDAAGVVDEVGKGVEGTRPGDEVSGWADPALREADAELAVLVAWAPRPESWTWASARGGGGRDGIPRARPAVGRGDAVLVQGAAGGTGTVVVQVAAARGATVIGTAGERDHAFLRTLGATPTAVGAGLVDRVRAVAPRGVDAVTDERGCDDPERDCSGGGPAVYGSEVGARHPPRERNIMATSRACASAPWIESSVGAGWLP